MFHEKHLTSGKRGRKGEKIFCKHKQKKLYSKFFLFIFFGVKNNYIPQKSLSRSAALVGRLFFCRLLHSANCLHSVFCYFAIIAILPNGKIWLNSKIVCLAANDAKHYIPAIGSIPQTTKKKTANIVPLRSLAPFAPFRYFLHQKITKYLLALPPSLATCQMFLVKHFAPVMMFF